MTAQYIDKLQTKDGIDLNLRDAEAHRILESLVMHGYPPNSVYISVAQASPHLLFGGDWEYLEDWHGLFGFYVYARVAEQEVAS